MKIVALLPVFLAAVSVAAQPSVRLHGSTTVQGAVKPRQAEIEAGLGRKLELRAVGSSAGLLALAGGSTDVAMISSPLEEVAARLNRQKPGTIDVAEFRAAKIGAVRIAFIVNPHNPVRQLATAQLADVLAGKVQNWREVGGPDLSVTVVSLANAGPLVEEQLLRGGTITAGARRMRTATQIPPVVAQEEGAIGIISTAHARGQTSLLDTDAELVTPLFLVTRGEPDPVQQRLIELARSALRESS